MIAQLERVRAAAEAARSATGAARADSGPPVLAVASGKGGVGTSTVAALLALAAAAAGRRTLLVEPDEHVGVLHLLLGVDRRHGLASLRDGIAPEGLLVPVISRLHLLPGGGDALRSTRTTSAEYRLLFRRAVALYATFDVVIVDAGSQAAGVLARVADGASMLVAVSGGDRVSAAATYALVKLIEREHPALRVDVLANRQSDSDALATYDAIGGAARRFLDRDLAFAGSVPDDAVVASTLSRVAHRASPAALEHSSAFAAAAAIGRRLLSPTTPAATSREQRLQPFHGAHDEYRPALASARPR